MEFILEHFEEWNIFKYINIIFKYFKYHVIKVVISTRSIMKKDFLKRDSEWFITIQNRNYEKIDASYTFHSLLN